MKKFYLSLSASIAHYKSSLFTGPFNWTKMKMDHLSEACVEGHVDDDV